MPPVRPPGTNASTSSSRSVSPAGRSVAGGASASSTPHPAPMRAPSSELLSVGAAYGLLVARLPARRGAGILGFQTVDSIEAWVPLFIYIVHTSRTILL